MELKGTDAVMKAIEKIAAKMGNVSVSVGFINNATYPDGTPVAAVAYFNEFGKTVASKEGTYFQLPRPFFRRMIAKESGSWPKKLAKLAKTTNYDGEKVMSIMGQDIVGALQQSINDLSNPPLAPSTIKAKKGVTKPLIDTATMIRAITFEVKK